MSICNVEPVLVGTIGPNSIVYDYAILPNNLISSVNVVSTPHVDMNGQLKYSHNDIESISVIHNGAIVDTTVNYDRTPSWGLAPLYIYQRHIIPILPSHLYLNNFNVNLAGPGATALVIRIIFWRAPASPLWLQLVY